MNSTMKVETFLVSLLLLIFAAQAFSQVFHTSATYDEPITIATGYYQLTTSDFQLNPTHPPLNFQIAALPLLFSKPQFPLDNEDCRAKKHWQCTEAFISANSEGMQRILFLARLPHILMGMLLGLVVYLWSRNLYGKKAALLSLVLFAFSPVMISFSGIAMQHIVVTFFIILTSFITLCTRSIVAATVPSSL